mgnify:CR=1 FL=1
MLLAGLSYCEQAIKLLDLINLSSGTRFDGELENIIAPVMYEVDISMTLCVVLWLLSLQAKTIFLDLMQINLYVGGSQLRH